jgi:MFS family permease
MNWRRLYFLLSAIAMMLLLGSIYAWGIFRVEVEAIYDVNATLSGLPYMFSLVSYAFSMLWAGRWMSTHRRIIVIAGMILFISGLWIASIPGSFLLLLLGYGILLGVGVGFLYGVPIFLVQRLFTTRVGLFSGLILMGFGLANTVMTPLIVTLLETSSISETFATLGWVAVIVLGLTVWPLFQPLKVNLGQDTVKEKPTYDRVAFRWLYVVFMLSIFSGLTIIGLSYRIGVVTYAFDVGFVTGAIAVFGLLNGLSRPFFGSLVDRFGFFKIAFTSLLSLVLSGFLSLFNGGSNPVLFAISYGAFWFGLGNWMALMPLAIKLLFPTALFSELYGKIFTAYGLAAIIGTFFSSAILDLTQATWPIYGLIVVGNITNLFIVFWLKKRYHLTFFIKEIF